MFGCCTNVATVHSFTDFCKVRVLVRISLIFCIWFFSRHCSLGKGSFTGKTEAHEIALCFSLLSEVNDLPSRSYSESLY